MADCALMGTEQPTLQKAGHTMAGWKKIFSNRSGCPQYTVFISLVRQTSVAAPTIRLHLAANIHHTGGVLLPEMAPTHPPLEPIEFVQSFCPSAVWPAKPGLCQLLHARVSRLFFLLHSFHPLLPPHPDDPDRAGPSLGAAYEAKSKRFYSSQVPELVEPPARWHRSSGW